MSTISTATKSSVVRDGLSHPVIDGDGHWMEPTETLVHYIRKVGGGSAADAYLKIHEQINGWYQVPPADRMRARAMRIPWWGGPAGTLDKATSILPDLMYRRLDEFGIDFCLISASRFGPGVQHPDPKLRRTFARAANIMNAELFADYTDRITPSAVLSMEHPDEAIEELEFAVQELGMKYVLIASVRRPVAALADEDADTWGGAPYYIDTFGMDSPYDYDPLWEKFVELKVAPCTHSGALGWVDRNSPTNFTYNHIGHFAHAAHAVAKSIYMGGVTRRFPTLRWGFLECGAGWARNLQTDLAGHWAKRNRETMLEHYAPTVTDLEELGRLIDRHGGELLSGRSETITSQPDATFPGVGAEELVERELATLDDFEAVDVHSKREVMEEFARNFHFGCEADDPMTMMAFDERFGTPLKALFGSDISHFDVLDMTEVLEEAYEMVEHGWIDEHQFRAFTFENVVSLHGGMNPDFFKGTVVEQAVAEELARQQSAADGDAPSV
jgi:predicted TIM-barrel fold metal-dependent hydrolase